MSGISKVSQVPESLLSFPQAPPITKNINYIGGTVASGIFKVRRRTLVNLYLNVAPQPHSMMKRSEQNIWTAALHLQWWTQQTVIGKTSQGSELQILPSLVANHVVQ